MGSLGGSVGCVSDLAQVIISRFVSLRPTLGSVLTAQSPEPALDSLSPLSLPLPCSHALSLSLSLSKINVKKIFLIK